MRLFIFVIENVYQTLYDPVLYEYNSNKLLTIKARLYQIFLYFYTMFLVILEGEH